MKTQTRLNPDSSHFSFFKKQTCILILVLFQKLGSRFSSLKKESNSCSNFENQTQFQFESYKPKMGISYSCQRGYSANTDPNLEAKENFKNAKKCRKRLDEHNLFTESIKVLKINTKRIYLYLCTYVCMGL